MRLGPVFFFYLFLVALYIRYIVANLKPGFYRLIGALPCFSANIAYVYLVKTGNDFIDTTVVPPVSMTLVFITNSKVRCIVHLVKQIKFLTLKYSLYTSCLTNQ